MLLSPSWQPDDVGLHRDEPVSIQHSAVIVKFPSIHPRMRFVTLVSTYKSSPRGPIEQHKALAS